MEIECLPTEFFYSRLISTDAAFALWSDISEAITAIDESRWERGLRADELYEQIRQRDAVNVSRSLLAEFREEWTASYRDSVWAFYEDDSRAICAAENSDLVHELHRKSAALESFPSLEAASVVCWALRAFLDLQPLIEGHSTFSADLRAGVLRSG